MYPLFVSLVCCCDMYVCSSRCASSHTPKDLTFTPYYMSTHAHVHTGGADFDFYTR